MAAFKSLDPLLHNELRLKIMSLLVSLEEAEFKFLLTETEASKGNLSVQLSKLKNVDYIKITKTFKNNYPHTSCSITKKGIKAFEEYVATISQYLKK